MIRCFIFCKDHVCRLKFPSGAKNFFEFRKGWYHLDILCGCHDKNDTSFFYMEGNPNPINTEEKDTMKFLDDINWESIMMQAHDKKLSPWESTLQQYLSSPGKIMSLFIVIFIIGATLWSFFGG